MIAGLFVLLLGYGLIIHGRILTAVVLLAITIGNIAHISDFLLLFLAPYRVFLLKKYGIGSTERIFLLMCNRKAKKLNMKLDWSLYSKTMKKPTNLVKKEEKQTTYEEDYNELLNDLAEARNAANQLRAELWKDDSSPFNPPLTEDEAYWVIKKSVEANKKKEQEKNMKEKEENNKKTI